MTILRQTLGALAALTASVGALTASAGAAPPVLQSVASDHLHPSAVFQAAGANYATIYLATSPQRGTDGRFLSENVQASDSLTGDEIQNGAWFDSSTVDPGHYWVLLRAYDYGCPDEPCVEGDSNLVELTIPRPFQRYRTSVQVLRHSRIVQLSLNIAPLGDHQPYRVCWHPARGPLQCVRGTVNGFSWRYDATDSVTVRLHGMKRRTTFSWVTGESDPRVVATRTVTTVPA